MAVYTKVPESDVASFLLAYDIGEIAELIGIKQGVENSNYVLRTTQKQFILTLYEKRTREEDLPFFLGFMQHLAKKGVPCPLPILTKTGESLGRLAERPAAITSFLNGKSATRISPNECAELGRALAAMHNAGADFTMERPNALSLSGWAGLVEACAPRADSVQAGLAHLLQQELAYLQENWPDGLPRGVIHADLFPDNVFFDGPQLCGLIDFYFACSDLLVYDLAICLNAWCFENNVAFNITKARALIKGYESVRPLSEEEMVALPLLARGSALRFLLTRLYDWLNQVPGALVKAKDPMEYYVRLQFHQRVENISAYGIGQ